MTSLGEAQACQTPGVRSGRRNIHISTDILWRVLHILMEPVSYTFVSVNRQNDEARATSVLTRAPSFRRFTDTNVGYTELVPLQCGKLATKYQWIFTVYCDINCRRSSSPHRVADFAVVDMMNG